MTGNSGSRLRLAPLAVSLLFAGQGCTTYQVASAPPAQVIAVEQPSRVLLTLRSNREVELFGPVVLDDSIRGHPRAESVQRQTIALTDIATIQTRRFNLGKSLLVTLGVAGGLAVYEILMSLNGTTP